MTFPPYEYAQPAPQPPQRRRGGRVIVTVLVAALIASAGIFATTNRQLLVDVWTAFTFTPSATLQS